MRTSPTMKSENYLKPGYGFPSSSALVTYWFQWVVAQAGMAEWHLLFRTIGGVILSQ